MKILRIAIVALLMPAIILSCKKNKDAPSPAEGDWSGLYGNDKDIPSILYKLNIRHGGVMEEKNVAGQVKGSGNWSLDGNSFTGHYQWKAPLNTIFTIKAIYDPAANKLTGTWGFDDSATDGGKWETAKIR